MSWTTMADSPCHTVQVESEDVAIRVTQREYTGSHAAHNVKLMHVAMGRPHRCEQTGRTEVH